MGPFVLLILYVPTHTDAVNVCIIENFELQSTNWQEFLTTMYGNQPTQWHKSLQGAQRARFIVNAMTRMRFIENQNELDFSCKTSPDQAPDKLTPWFKVVNKKLKTNQKIVFGHWASLNGKTHDNQFFGLDTGYVWRQNMTLLNLSSGEVFSVRYQD